MTIFITAVITFIVSFIAGWILRARMVDDYAVHLRERLIETEAELDTCRTRWNNAVRNN